MFKWFNISWRNVIRNYRRSMTAILTVAIASAALMLSYAFINFTFWGLTAQIVQGGTGNMHIADKRYFDDFETAQLEFGINKSDVNETISNLNKQRPIKQVLQRIKFSGLVSSGDVSTIFTGTGIDSKAENRLRSGNSIGRYIKGKRIKGDNIYQIELAVDLARKLKVDVGDTVTVLSTMGDGGMNALDAKVAGIYVTGVPERNLIELKVPLKFAQELIQTDKISYMVVQLRDIQATEKYLPSVKDKINDSMRVVPWWHIEPYFLSVRRLYYSIFSVMGAIILIVVLLSVSNVMNTSVMERTHEIGTLRAFGISKNRMRANFITEGLIIGFIGSLLGVILTLVITIIVAKVGYMMPAPPGRSQGYPLLLLPTVNSVLIVTIVMWVVSALASYLPINKVVKKKVLEQLNHV